MEKLIYLFLLIGFIFGFVVGLFLATKPRWAIELQKKFYAKINWNIEPISFEKEIRNTRLMGLFLIGLAVIGIIFVLYRINPKYAGDVLAHPVLLWAGISPAHTFSIFYLLICHLFSFMIGR